ncbi:TPA: GTP-binding protein [archaeon]|nr:GTP-binding protein [Candidatus Naiadarchaeales archaeon SRR2090153.bin1042]
MSTEEKIKQIEEEIQKTPYNKASQHHIGKLKAKIAHLRMQMEAGKGGRKGAASIGYSIKKSGDATVVIVGFPSAGKSTLLNALSGEELSKVAAYEFTTLTVIPAMLKYKGANIQLLDVPGLITGAAHGKGRGKEVLAVLRNADILIILVDAEKLWQLNAIKEELQNAGIRLNQNPPRVEIEKKIRGGGGITKSINVQLTDIEIIAVLNEFGIHSADVSIKDSITIEQLIDVVAGNRKYIKALFVVNKVDLVNRNEILKDLIQISAEKGEGVKQLKDEIYKKLGFIRIYLKPPGREADFVNPLILQEGATIENVCKKLHKAFVSKFKYAQVTGKSVKFKEQRVGLEHELKDEDVVTIFVRE